MENGLDLGMGKQTRTPLLGTFGQRLSNVDGVSIAIRGNMNATEEVIGLDQWVSLSDLGHRQYIDLEPKYLGHGGTSF